MNEQQHETQKQTNTADDDVRVAQERIFSAEYWRRRENEQLGAVELSNWVVWKISMWWHVEGALVSVYSL